MGKKLKLTNVLEGQVQSKKIDLKGTISINERDSIEKIYDVINSLSENQLSKSSEQGGYAINKNEFTQEVLMMIQEGGKFQLNLTIL